MDDVPVMLFGDARLVQHRQRLVVFLHERVAQTAVIDVVTEESHHQSQALTKINRLKQVNLKSDVLTSRNCRITLID